MFISLNDRQRQQIGNIFLLILSIGFLLAIWGTYVRVSEGIAETKVELQKSGTLLAEELDHELDIHIYNLLAMKYVSERYFSGRAVGVENPIQRLQATKDYEGYESVLPNDFGNFEHLGRFTGFGPIPDKNDPVAQEMMMVIGLTPLMRAIRERSSDVPWVQYASARGFMFIFPYRGSEQFFFKPDLMQRDYFALATPQANPQRKVFWSKPYADAAGKGNIVTVTQAIYQDHLFRGSLSIDVLVSSLQRRLSSTAISDTHLRLVDPHGTIIAATSDQEISQEQALTVIKLALKSAPWTLELHMNQSDLLLRSLMGRSWHILTLLVLAITLVAVILLTRKSRQIHQLSIRDGLTGLFNRRYFDVIARQQFELVKRRHLSMGLAIMDIDFFKKYNDHYGHQEGDKALRAVAAAMKAALRRGSDQIFRVGGEEFAVLMPLKDLAELSALMEKLNQAVRDLQLPHVGNTCGFMTISIGATMICSDNWVTLDAAYKQADDFLYQAKTSGRDRAVVPSQ